MSEADPLRRLNALEWESAVRQVVMRYFRICDDLGPHTPFDELGELFVRDAVWEGKGRYAKSFGRYEGREAIVAMIRSYCVPQSHFAMTAHYLSSEEITVGEDNGTGRWMMLQASDYTDGTSDFRSARLTIGCRRDGRMWRIAHFLTENVFSRQSQRWNDEETIAVPEGGYSGVLK